MHSYGSWVMSAAGQSCSASVTPLLLTFSMSRGALSTLRMVYLLWRL